MLGQSGLRTRERRGDGFKKGLDTGEARRRREENAVNLRRQKREDQLAKRRQTTQGGGMGVLHNLGEDPQPTDRRVIEGLTKLPEYTKKIASTNDEDVLEATRQFRRLLSIEKCPPITQVIRTGVVPRLVELLKWNDKKVIQFEAAWALTNIASGSSQQTAVVVDRGAVPIFVELLGSPHAEVREQAVWAVGNIAGDSVLCRDLVLSCNAIPRLANLVQPHVKDALVRNIAWTISNLCRGKPQPRFGYVVHALPCLNILLNNWTQDKDVAADACWALSYLSDDNTDENEHIEAVVMSGVTPSVAHLLNNTNTNIITPALRTIGNIVTGTDKQTTMAIESGCLPPLKMLLRHDKPSIKKEACWAISNITAGTPDQISKIFEAQIVGDLVQILDREVFEVQKEACWAITNISSSSNYHHTRSLVEDYNVLGPLCRILGCEDARIILVALEGLRNILTVEKNLVDNGTFEDNIYLDLIEECNGTNYIEDLQMYNSSKVKQKAEQLVTDFFDFEEDDDEDDDGHLAFS